MLILRREFSLRSRRNMRRLHREALRFGSRFRWVKLFLALIVDAMGGVIEVLSSKRCCSCGVIET